MDRKDKSSSVQTAANQLSDSGDKKENINTRTRRDASGKWFDYICCYGNINFLHMMSLGKPVIQKISFIQKEWIFFGLLDLCFSFEISAIY